jgi:hypothetical protein
LSTFSGYSSGKGAITAMAISKRIPVDRRKVAVKLEIQRDFIINIVTTERVKKQQVFVTKEGQNDRQR